LNIESRGDRLRGEKIIENGRPRKHKGQYPVLPEEDEGKPGDYIINLL